MKYSAQLHLADSARFAPLARHWSIGPDDGLFSSIPYLVWFSLSRMGFSADDYVCPVQEVYKRKALGDRVRIVSKGIPTKAPSGGTIMIVSGKARSEPAAPPQALPSLDLKWLFAAMKSGTDRSSSEQLMNTIAGLNEVLKSRKFAELNLILGMIHPQRLSPELMLTFARVTFPVRELLPNWFPLVRRIKNELERRNLDSKQLLNGLI